MQRQFLFIALLALLLAACGGNGGTGGGGGVSLDQNVEVGGLSVSYPDGWVVDDSQGLEGGIVLANSQEALDASIATGADEAPPSGSAVMSILLAPTEQLGISNPTARNVLDTFFGFMTGEDMPEFDDPSESTIGGNTVVQSHGSDDQISVTFYSIELDGAFVIASAGTPAGEFDDWQATFEAIVGSMSFSDGG